MPSRRLRKSFRLLLLLGLLGFALAVPAHGFAAKNVPPGNSEIDQYTETLPGASGSQPTDGQGSGGASTGGALGGGAPVLSEQVAQQLRRRGPTGRAVADLAEATAPKGKAASGKTGGGGSSSGLDSVADTVSGSDGGGLGILLPLILGGVAAAGLGYVLLRRRARLPG